MCAGCNHVVIRIACCCAGVPMRSLTLKPSIRAWAVAAPRSSAPFAPVVQLHVVLAIGTVNPTSLAMA